MQLDCKMLLAEGRAAQNLSCMRSHNAMLLPVLLWRTTELQTCCSVPCRLMRQSKRVVWTSLPLGRDRTPLQCISYCGTWPNPGWQMPSTSDSEWGSPSWWLLTVTQLPTSICRCWAVLHMSNACPALQVTGLSGHIASMHSAGPQSAKVRIASIKRLSSTPSDWAVRPYCKHA